MYTLANYLDAYNILDVVVPPTPTCLFSRPRSVQRLSPSFPAPARTHYSVSPPPLSPSIHCMYLPRSAKLSLLYASSRAFKYLSFRERVSRRASGRAGGNSKQSLYQRNLDYDKVAARRRRCTHACARFVVPKISYTHATQVPVVILIFFFFTAIRP